MILNWNDFLPQGEEITSLRKQIDEGKMVHALLVSGETGLGKKSFARLTARTLLCSSKEGKPCGRCNGCLMAQKEEHPDMIILSRGRSLTGVTAKNKAAIPVGEIREMIRLASVWSFEGGNRIIIIDQAEDMNPQAQNCLLKILEEPPANTYFILTSDHQDQLLTTVRSRCRLLKMKPWNDDYIRDVLVRQGIDQEKAAIVSRIVHGSVGNALRLAADSEYWANRAEIIRSFFNIGERSEILRISGQWKERKTDSEMLFNTLDDVVRGMLAYRLNPGDKASVADLPDAWITFAKKAGFDKFSQLLDRIAESRKQCSFNVNFQAVFEQLLLSFIGMIGEYA